MTISFYNNTFDKNNSVVSPGQAMEGILTGLWKDTIDYLRSLKNEAEYKNQKQKLPAVTWSGVFEEGTRSIESLKAYSGLVCLDVDHLEPANIAALKSQLVKDDYVFFCFTSPSGKGIKIIVQVNSKAENHRSAFLHLQFYFENKFLIKIDKSGKDVCRLCYLSYDPAPVINPDSKVFDVDPKYGEIITVTQSASDYKATKDNDTIFKVCVGWIEKRNNFVYVEGERNHYLHALSCALNRCGVEMEDCIQLISKNYAVPDIKWHQTVKSAYFNNQGEHGKVAVRDLGTHEFVAPPYITNYTDDVAANDLMTITAMLYTHKVDKANISGIVAKIAKYYKLMGYIDINRSSLGELMNKAVQVLTENIAANAGQNKLEYQSSEDLANELIGQDVVAGVIPTTFNWFDSAMRGGMQPANFYGLIGVGGTFKSVLAQFWSYNAACNDYPVLYLSGEMSLYQYYERLVLMVFGINLYYEMQQGRLSKENVTEFINKMKLITKNNLFFFNGSGYNKTNINATIDHIYATTGKKVKLVVLDGLSQMDSGGREEIPAAIMNAGVCKELAKSANGGEGTVVLGLIHVSGEQEGAKLRRDNGPKVRGGGKILANLDGYFSTSLLIDPNGTSIDNPEDVAFIPGKVYVRLVDKRSPAGIISCIVEVEKNLHLKMEDVDPRQYELKIN